MDRGIPTEEVLQEMKRSDPPAAYLVGTPKGRLNKLETELALQPWQQAREGVEVEFADTRTGDLCSGPEWTASPRRGPCDAGVCDATWIG